MIMGRGEGLKQRSQMVMALLSVLSAAFLSHGADSASALELQPGVVVDAELGLIFLMNPEGGIDAVQLLDGNVKWHSDHGDRPLVVVGDRLLSQVGVREAGRNLSDHIRHVGIRHRDTAGVESWQARFRKIH